MIVTLNVGSSSIKYAFFQQDLKPIESGEVQSIDSLMSQMSDAKAIGHRLVFGGQEFTKPTRLTEQTLKKLEALTPLSPLHLAKELSLVQKLQEAKVPQVACFDTAFHQAMPSIHKHFPLPSFLWKEGIKRYGFHGLSYESILHTLGEEARGKKVIIAHLGSGSSLAAIDNTHPIDTTMGLTPCGGVMMGTRCGDLDPGVLTYLMREKGYGPTQIDALINQQSGLLGVSNLSSDMKTLLSSKEPLAKLAIDLYCSSIRKSIGALTATLGGLDQLIFTGGIGQASKEIRDQIIHGLAFLDIHEKTTAIPTDENRMIALHTKELLGL